jgi:hypothetical protein
MTVTSEVARTEHAGNGITVSFSTGFPFAANEEVRVILKDAAGGESEWSEGVQYTLSGAGTGTNGTIKVQTSPTNYTPQNGETLIVLHNISLLQTLNADVLNTLPASDMEASLDRIYRALQMLKEQIGRAIVATPGGEFPDLAGWSPILAVESDNARRVLKVIDWTGGIADKPQVNVYLGGTGFVSDIASAIDIRGPQGAAGSGSGDMLAANNLSDLIDFAAARSNLGLNSIYLRLAQNLADLADIPTARENIGAHNASNLTAGTVSIARLPEATAAQFRNNTADRLLSTDQVWSAADFVTLTDAATIAVNMGTGINFTVTLGGNRTLGNPTNEKPGQSGMIEVVQDATGGRTLSFGNQYKFADGVAPTIASAANAKSVLAYFVRAVNEVWVSMPLRNVS